MLQVTKTLLGTLLAKSKFDPRQAQGPLSIVVNMDPSYLELKAVELVHQAQQSVQLSLSPEEYETRIEQAVSLLVLARAKRQIVRENNGTAKAKRTKEGSGTNHRGRNQALPITKGVAHDQDPREYVPERATGSVVHEQKVRDEMGGGKEQG